MEKTTTENSRVCYTMNKINDIKLHGVRMQGHIVYVQYLLKLNLFQKATNQ